MTGIIDRGTVEQYQVLRRLAAAHLVASGGFVLTLHAGQQLQTLDDVLLAKQRRHLGQRGHVDLLDTYLHLVHALLCRA